MVRFTVSASYHFLISRNLLSLTIHSMDPSPHTLVIFPNSSIYHCKTIVSQDQFQTL
uniref:LRR-RLK n=1 Tax=Rhizophora mucronata TaxID=61149 RepID=A0A2P2L2E7_RHIMU